MKKLNILHLIMASIFLVSIGCEKEEDGIVTDVLIIEDIVIGDGAEAKALDKVTVEYTGKLGDVPVFD